MSDSESDARLVRLSCLVLKRSKFGLKAIQHHNYRIPSNSVVSDVMARPNCQPFINVSREILPPPGRLLPASLFDNVGSTLCNAAND